MRIHEIIQEARRNPEVNKTPLPIEQLKTLHADAAGNISANVTNLFISMTELDKLGINPNSIYDTPIGIYSYSVDYVLSKVKNNLTDLPFVGDQPFINVFKAANAKSVIVLNEMTSSDLDSYIAKINNIQEFAKHVPPTETYTSKAPVKSPGGMFWYITLTIAEKLAKISKRKTPIVWNTVFRKLGISGCVDTGDSIIHTNEPAQAVFFNTASISVITQINNKQTGNRDKLLTMLNNAYRLGKDKRKPEIEKVMLTSPEFAFKYAKYIIGDAWPVAEKIIATSPEFSYKYAKEVLKGKPFPAGEKAIETSKYYSVMYAALMKYSKFTNAIKSKIKW